MKCFNCGDEAGPGNDLCRTCVEKVMPQLAQELARREGLAGMIGRMLVEVQGEAAR